MRSGQVQTFSYLRGKFRDYYTVRAKSIEMPPGLDRREFGFLLFDENTMFRHLGFKSTEELVDYLRTSAPAHVYYSSAYYEEPEEEMEKKGWLGADLVFDIDADHLETPCKARHDKWICRNCGREENGSPPETCPKCGKSSFSEETWFCENCLEAAKRETLKLVDILTQDLGFSPKGELSINFSGNRGYHVHIYDEETSHLDQLSRREIVDYVRGTGLEARFHGFGDAVRGSPSFAGFGWSGRVARALYSFLLDLDRKAVKKLGLSEKTVESLAERKEELLAYLREGPAGQEMNLLSPKDRKVFDRLVQEAVVLEAAAIDTVVTADIHRLIRLPMTIHGKTGLRAEQVSVDLLEGFDPLKKAVAFDTGEMTIHIKEAPEFRVGDRVFGPFKDETVELPSAAAVLLLCKGAASVVA